MSQEKSQEPNFSSVHCHCREWTASQPFLVALVVIAADVNQSGTQ
jgi:hypothetical protein